MSKKEYMFDQVSKYIESKQTQLEFSMNKDYSYDCLKYWIKQYRNEGHEVPVVKTQTSFQEIKIESIGEDSTRKILELSTPSGLCIKIFE